MEDFIVSAACGKIRGEKEKNVCVFRGIPYAEPPVGKLRCKKTRPAKPWAGVRDCTRFGPICPQGMGKKREESEDCLTLNIWSPQCDNAKRAVLVYIHGGSFMSGAGSDSMYDGTNMAQAREVVVVTLNYRLGPFGFLDFSFLDPEFTANCGLYDIVQALSWVKDNIESFGGDPDNITVFGQSAGGTVCAALPVIPAGKGLIAKSVVMSGCPTLLQNKEDCENAARRFAQRYSIQTTEDLFRIPASVMGERGIEFSKECGLGVGTYRMTAGTEIIPDFLLPEAKKGAGEGIPMMIGTTKEEMSFLLIPPVAKALDIDGIMNAGLTEECEETKERTPRVYREVYKNKRLWQSMLFTDMCFRVGTVWYAEQYSRFSPTWMYRFDYETAAMKVSRLHAFHSCELPFVFGNYKAGMAKLIFLFTPVKTEVRRISDAIQKDITDFAKTGELNWEKCTETRTPAKRYAKETRVAPMMIPMIKEQYESTNFKKIVFQSVKKP